MAPISSWGFNAPAKPQVRIPEGVSFWKYLSRAAKALRRPMPVTRVRTPGGGLKNLASSFTANVMRRGALILFRISRRRFVRGLFRGDERGFFFAGAGFLDELAVGGHGQEW